MNNSVKKGPAVYPVQKCIAGEDFNRLSDTELLAIILNTGSKEKNVLELASELLNYFGGIAGVFYSGIRELSSKKGIGLKKAVKVHAAFELGRRIISKEKKNIVVNTPLKVWELLLPEILGLCQEEFRVIVLNNKNHVIKNKVVSIGTVSEAIVHPREIFRDAIRESGASIIVAHNHPSGILLPSKEDIATTKRIIQAGQIIGIELLDHVIISESSFLSMKEAGYM